MTTDLDRMVDLDWHDIAEGCLMHDSAHALAAWADLRRLLPREPDTADCE